MTDQTLFDAASSSPSPRRHTPATLCQIRLITARQLQCLSWVQEGKSATDIGVILGLSGRTVEKHIIKVRGHLEVKIRIQAVVGARELGLITGARG